MARLNGAATRMAIPLACSSPPAAFSPSASTTRKRKGPHRRRQACPASARRRPHGRARKARKASPASSKRRAAPSQSKQDLVIQMLRRQSGVTIEDIIAKTGWQPHSVRGFFSGLVKKKLKLPLVSEVGKDGVRRYHIAPIASIQGVSHDAVFAASPAPAQTARAILRPIRARRDEPSPAAAGCPRGAEP